MPNNILAAGDTKFFMLGGTALLTSVFYASSHNYQHFLKNNTYILQQIVPWYSKWHLNMCFLSYLPKQYFYYFNPYLKKHLAYYNSKTILEFLGQFALNAYIIFRKKKTIILRWYIKHANLKLEVHACK